MKKTIISALTLFVLILLPFNISHATSGACSYHGGVNYSSGSDYDGSVICNDGWRDSSVRFSDMKDTTSHQSKYSFDSCEYSNDYNKCFDTVADLKLFEMCENSRGIGSTFDKVKQECSSNTAQQITTRQRHIDESFTKYYNLALDRLPEYKPIVDPEVIKRLSLDPSNKDKTFSQLIIETYQSKLLKEIVVTNPIISTEKPVQIVPKKESQIKSMKLEPPAFVSSTSLSKASLVIQASTTLNVPTNKEGVIRRLWIYITNLW